MRTYYDVLQVSESAAEDVIRAAYRVLAKRLHPDLNGGDTNSRLEMQLLNESYAVLSDPNRRREYNQILAAKRSRPEPTSRSSANQNQSPPVAPSQSGSTAQARTDSGRGSSPRHAKGTSSSGRFGGVLVAIAAFAFLLWLAIAQNGEKKSTGPRYQSYPPTVNDQLDNAKTSPTKERPNFGKRDLEQLQTLFDEVGRDKEARRARAVVPEAVVEPSSYQAVVPAAPVERAKPTYQRPTRSPAGTPWPQFAAYVEGYSILAKGGLSRVTVDNSANPSDVFVKLVRIAPNVAYPVRACFIPAFSQFTFESVDADHYDVRYRDLSDGGFMKTQEFDLVERKTYNGIQYSRLTMTLYKVENGNMETESIKESEF
jgi:curved DNA-binding protein CbpA